jgi:hypothetical protein
MLVLMLLSSINRMLHEFLIVFVRDHVTCRHHLTVICDVSVPVTMKITVFYDEMPCGV